MQQSSSILVTGSAGFIGSHVYSHLCDYYADQYNIIGIDRHSYCSSHKTPHPRGSSIRNDICDFEQVENIFRENNVQIILHFAAQTHVDNSFGNSIHFSRDNVIGTHTLLEAARQFNCKLFIHMSTDEVYGSQSGGASTETSYLEPTNPYAATKAGAEMLVKSYCTSFGLKAIIVRANNVYGPGQFPEKLIPKMILRLLNGKKCQIHGDGKQLRSWLYIQDLVAAFDALVRSYLFSNEHIPKYGEVYNIGTTQECDVKTVCQKIVTALYPKDDKERIEYTEDRCFNDKRYLIDSTKIRILTGWSPWTNFDDGLKDTIQWYMRIEPADYWNLNEVAKACYST
jgi:dTDP-glucose 4,6-dehydratase